MGEKSSKSVLECSDEERNEVNFGHFEVLRSIGKGGFGKVCIVKKRSTGTVFAMKYMNKQENWHKGHVETIMNELLIISQLSHPFIVNLWYTFQDEEDIFMVSDLLLGGDLRYHINKDVAFSQGAIRLYLCQLALVLDYLKEQRIIHRDIKPDNLLLDEAGFIYLTDFNVAMELSESKPYATSFAGTMPYAAPEVYETALGFACGYDYSVDWWSLGVTIYELLSRKRPFEIESNSNHVQAIASIRRSSSHFSNKQKSPIKETIAKLLRVSPSERVCNFASLCELEFCSGCLKDDVLAKKMSPDFIPSSTRLNYDPVYELEEMLVESNPLHKKKKRLQKRRSEKRLKVTENTVNEQESETPEQAALREIENQFVPYNRERSLNCDSSKQE